MKFNISRPLFLLFFVNIANAVPVPITNPDFETPILPPGQLEYEITDHGWTQTTEEVTDAFIEHVVNFSGSGQNHLALRSGIGVQQILTDTFQPNSIYTLRLKIGNRLGQTNQDGLARTIYNLRGRVENSSFKLITDTDFASGNTFAEAPVIRLNTQLTPEIIGQPITIEIRNVGQGRAHIDDLSLDVSSGPVVSTSSDSGPGSLRQAIADAESGDTIFFDPLIFNARSERVINLESELIFDARNISIDATTIPNGVALRGNGRSRIVSITTAGAEITFRKLHLTNGFSNGNGGAVRCFSGTQFTLEKCSITDSSSSALGGGIWTAGNVTLINTTLSDNFALGDAGGLFAESGDVDLIHCTFYQNRSQQGVGGIKTMSGNLKIQNSHIGSNRRGAITSTSYDDLFIGSTFSRTGVNVFGTNSGIEVLSGMPNAVGDYVGSNENPILIPLFELPDITETPSQFNSLVSDPGSLLIGRGAFVAGNPDDDQIGRFRFQSSPDIGAIEIRWGSEFGFPPETGFPAPSEIVADMVYPDDPIVHFGNENSPTGEDFLNAFDDDPETKYLNFNRFDVGMTVTTFVPTQLSGLALTSANDVPERDPGAVLIFGINPDGASDLIATLNKPVFNDRLERMVYFMGADTRAYSTFRIVFRGTSDSPANSIQIAEIELIGAPADRSLRIVKSSNLTEEIQTAQGSQLTNITTIEWVSDPTKIYGIEESPVLRDSWNLGFPRYRGNGFRTSARVFTNADETKAFFRVIETQ